MGRVDLKVPFSEKDQVKSLGARWDGERKIWYVPEGVDSRPFAKWLPPRERYAIEADYFLLAQSVQRCWKCREDSAVFSLVIPPGGQILEPGDDEFDDEWWTLDNAVALSHVSRLSNEVATLLKDITPNYCPGFSKTMGSTLWINHCEHCGANIGDFFLHSEPGGAFCPMDEEEASRIELTEIDSPICADGDECGGSYFP